MPKMHPFIIPALQQRMEELSYVKPTDIQKVTWDHLLEKHQDFVGQAHTGSGKTIAYGVPLLQRIESKQNVIQALVLVPTRELAQQTSKNLFRLAKNLPKLFVEKISGGEPIEDQQYRLKRPTHLIVATPGRLWELLKLKALDLSRVKTIVFDEADELYAKGFMKEIDKILECTNDFNKKWMFSATIHGELNSWIRNNLALDCPKIVLKTEEVMNPNIEHQYLECQKEDKVQYLLEFLFQMKKGRGIIFCRTKGDAEHVHRQLINQEYKATLLYGEMPTKEREKNVRMYHQGAFQVIVATDIVARGMDFEDLSFVLHYQLPDDPDYYTHRSGRTARAGKKGLSLVLLEPVERKKMRYIQELLGVDFTQV